MFYFFSYLNKIRECAMLDFDVCPLNLLGAHFPTLPAYFRTKVFQQLDTAMQSEPVPPSLLDDYTFFSFVDPDSSTSRQMTEPFAELVKRQSAQETEAFRNIRNIVNVDGRPGFKDEPHDFDFDFDFLKRISTHAPINADDEVVLRCMIEKRTTRRYSCLHAAMYKGYDGFVSIFVDYGGNVNEAAEQGWTALHEAVYHGHISCTELLLKHGAISSEQATFEGRDWTPLVVSVVESKLEMVKFLLSQNVDPWLPDNSVFRATAAHRAAEIAPESLTILLEHDPHLVFARDTRLETPLHSAANCGNIQTIKILVQHHADINAMDLNKRTPLHDAWKSLHSLPAYKQNFDNASNFMSLILAALHRSRELLIELGADLDARDAADETPSVGAYTHAWTSHGKNKGSLRLKFGSGIYSWDRAITNCIAAWHRQR
jgi:ankyrin repeat protein